jgi:hypothetical protein
MKSLGTRASGAEHHTCAAGDHSGRTDLSNPKRMCGDHTERFKDDEKILGRDFTWFTALEHLFAIDPCVYGTQTPRRKVRNPTRTYGYGFSQSGTGAGLTWAYGFDGNPQVKTFRRQTWVEWAESYVLSTRLR